MCVYSSVTPLPSVCPHSYSLEGLSGAQEELRGPNTQGPRVLEPSRMPRHDSDDRGSLVSLTEEREGPGQHGRLQDPVSNSFTTNLRYLYFT